MFLEGENGMTIPVSIHCAGNSKISTNARKKDAITISPIVDLENICKDSKAIAGKLLKPSAIHFGSFADEKKEKDKNNIAAIMSCNNRVRKVNPLMNYNTENMPKPRTALFQGSENDEPMTIQNIHAEKSIIGSNMATSISYVSPIKFGAFICDGKYRKKDYSFPATGLLSKIYLGDAPLFKRKDNLPILQSLRWRI